MKVLCVNFVISEYGGVEIAAMNLASGLVKRGHEVHFLAASGQRAPLASRDNSAGNPPQDRRQTLHCHYRDFPRIYSLDEHDHGVLRKLIWHAQDLGHPKNEKLFAEVLGQVRPDIIVLHNISAVGLNIWRTIRKSRVPCIQVIHDLNLICLNMQRFRSGRQCNGLCVACRIQKLLRFSMISDASNFAFVSPSQATLKEIERYADLSKWRKAVIPNANPFLVKPRKTHSLETPRLLYIGRLEASKGVEMMLRAARAARDAADFHLDILGTGVLEGQLRQSYSRAAWVTFHGSVDQETVADFMSQATILLVPSLWLETVPGVAVHALFAGLPVLGSRIGGIPEHVMDGQTGRLLPPGDETAWSVEIKRTLADRQQIIAWSLACLEAAQKFDPALAFDKYERLMQEMVAASIDAQRAKMQMHSQP
jgi:glycosyltransferase involved in cell wall biosynthesis